MSAKFSGGSFLNKLLPVLPTGYSPSMNDSSRPLIIAPSILASNFSSLGEEVKRAEAAGGDWMHLDIMDGHFVDNISFGPAVVAAVRKETKLPLDVHLMISRPDHYWPRFQEAGADRITVHVEADHKVSDTLEAIRAAGIKVGLAINPPTPLEKALPFLKDLDLLLVMTVNPGFGGQSFIWETMTKVSKAASIRAEQGLDFEIEVDGGIQAETARVAVQHGANVLVAGTSLFHAEDMKAAILEMRG